MLGSKMPMLIVRSTTSSISVIASTGVASTWISAVLYSAHRNSGMRNQVMPGGRSLCTVTTKFMPVKMLLKPRMNTPKSTGITPPAVVVVEYGV